MQSNEKLCRNNCDNCKCTTKSICDEAKEITADKRRRKMKLPDKEYVKKVLEPVFDRGRARNDYDEFLADMVDVVHGMIEVRVSTLQEELDQFHGLWKVGRWYKIDDMNPKIIEDGYSIVGKTDNHIYIMYWNRDEEWWEAVNGGEISTKLDPKLWTPLPFFKTHAPITFDEIPSNQDAVFLGTGSFNVTDKDFKQFDSICDEAKEITSGERMDQYGHPKQNFKNIASLWNAYINNRVGPNRTRTLDNLLKPEDVSMMMILFKVAREQNGHKRDNVVDIAGYARTIAQIKGEE